MLRSLKGSALASFFLCVSCVVQALPEQLSLQWQALLHLDGDGQPKITDAGFILSGDSFSPELEWKLTKALFAQYPSQICRFPARYLLMNSVENLPLFPDCPGYQEFLDKAPADEISVVYASENLTNPSSMMGHSMLALEGIRDDGKKARHAVSFFTELDSLNPITLVWDTVVKGKPGFFLVKPLDKHVDYYNEDEQRNVWRYVLALSESDRRLLQAHIWELKFPRIDYFFDSHNCATLSLDIVRVANPHLQHIDTVTPLDLVKTVFSSGMVATTEVVLSDKWKIRQLAESSNQPVIEAAEKFRHNGELSLKSSNDEDFQRFFELSSALVSFDYTNGDLDKNEYWQRRRVLQSVTPEQPKIQHIETYKSPLNTPHDAQLATGWMSYRNEGWLTLRTLPAARTFDDDNRAFFGENELRLNELQLRWSPTLNALQLHSWQLYSASSLTPRDPIIGGLSGHFQASFRPIYDHRLNPQTGLSISGGTGVTHTWGAGLSTYGLLNIGTEIGPSQSHVYLQPVVGAYLYSALNMKSRISYEPQLRSDGRRLDRWSLGHSISWGGSALVAKGQMVRFRSRLQRSLQVEWRWYY